MTSHRVEDTICEQERKPIRDCCGIEFSVDFHGDPDFPGFLGDDDDGALPCGPFYRSYKTDLEEFVYFFFDLSRVVRVHTALCLLDRSSVR